MTSIYKDPRWQKTRRIVLARDGYKCVLCGNDVSGWKQSRVDHVSYADPFDPNNCRTLCPACDNRKHAEKGSKGSVGRIEKILPGCDINGMPIDPDHPWNKRR